MSIVRSLLSNPAYVDTVLTTLLQPIGLAHHLRYQFIPVTTKNIGKAYVKPGRKTYKPNGKREVMRRLRQESDRMYRLCPFGRSLPLAAE
jgi:hypothetical protein